MSSADKKVVLEMSIIISPALIQTASEWLTTCRNLPCSRCKGQQNKYRKYGNGAVPYGSDRLCDGLFAPVRRRRGLTVGREKTHAVEWSYLNKGVHEEGRDEEFDLPLVREMLAVMMEIDVAIEANGK